jgi:hypothetical protein
MKNGLGKNAEQYNIRLLCSFYGLGILSCAVFLRYSYARKYMILLLYKNRLLYTVCIPSDKTCLSWLCVYIYNNIMSFITCQDQNHIWDLGVPKNLIKALDNLVIYRLNIIETDFRLGKTTLFKHFYQFFSVVKRAIQACSIITGSFMSLYLLPMANSIGIILEYGHIVFHSVKVTIVSFTTRILEHNMYINVLCSLHVTNLVSLEVRCLNQIILNRICLNRSDTWPINLMAF